MFPLKAMIQGCCKCHFSLGLEKKILLPVLGPHRGPIIIQHLAQLPSSVLKIKCENNNPHPMHTHTHRIISVYWCKAGSLPEIHLRRKTHLEHWIRAIGWCGRWCIPAVSVVLAEYSFFSPIIKIYFFLGQCLKQLNNRWKSIVWKGKI